MAFNPKEYEDDEDFKKFITETVSAATKGLVSKKEELLESVAKLKEKLNVLPDSETLEKLQAAQAKLDSIEQQTLEKNGEYTKIIDNMKTQHASEIETFKATISGMKTSLHKNLVDGALTKQLAAKKVKPELTEAAVRLLASDVSVIEESGEYVAKVGDKTVEQYVTDWAGSDVGKNFVLADSNGGGGAGGEGGGGSTTGFEKFFDPKSPDFNQTEQMKVYREHPKIYDELKTKYTNNAA